MNSIDKAGFSAAIQPHFDKLYRLAYRLTGSKADAEDLLQDVLTKLYERRTELSSIRSLSPWLGRVVYNQFVDNSRSYGRKALLLVGDSSADLEAAVNKPLSADIRDEPDSGAEQAEELGKLTAALARLSEEHRIVLLMHDSEGYKLVEIQEITGLPIGTVKSRLHRARARLREILSDTDTTPSSSPEEKSAKTGNLFGSQIV